MPNKAWADDISASIVVFLVAMPLCLGIALASGAPLFAGIIAGIVGGIVVGSISGSSVSVSGPAAGLTVIVFEAIQSTGNYNVFLTAVVLAGVFQILFGIARGGVLGYYFPNSVIHGMLAAIGLILILKQIPHAVGYDADFEGDFAFIQADNHNTFTEIYYAFQAIQPGAVIIGLISLIVLVLWDLPGIKKFKFFKIFPGSLFVVLFGVFANYSYQVYMPEFYIDKSHLVSLPVFSSARDALDQLSFPAASAILESKVWVIGFTVAVVASIESLLSVEAADRIDPYNRLTPSNRELIAQGTGNIFSGLLGGLPVTAVIVRTSANVASGGKTKKSAILHGFWLLISVLFIGKYLNYIPLTSLAAVLLVVGYKLTKPQLYMKVWKQGYNQFLPFMITVLAILFTNLLVGTGIGLAVGLIFILKANFNNCITFIKDGNDYLIAFRKDISFLSKPQVRNALAKIPDGAHLLLDASRQIFIDRDVLDSIQDFIDSADKRNISIEIRKAAYSRYPLFSKEIVSENA